MAAYQYIYVMKRLTKIFPGGKKILENVTLAFMPGAKIGVLGPNGAGKSTLLRIMAGLDQDIGGEAWAAEGVKVGYLEQEPQLDPAKDVLGNVVEGMGETKALVDRFNEVSNQFAEPDADFDALMAEQAELQEKIDACNGWELERTLEMAMDALRCPPGDADVTTLSGGERRRVALCRLLLSQPDLLLLDEPTNHLDAESVAWLERHLQEYEGTVIAVTHDRYFLDNVAGWILELDRGEGIPWKGNYSSWLEQKAKRLEQEERTESKRRKTLERELEWIRMAPKARQAKGKARLNAYERLAEEEVREKEAKLELYIPPGPRLGDVVINAEGLTKGFGNRLLFENFTFSVPRNAVVGIIGPNGVGKSTLFRIIMGLEKPDNGSVEIGNTVQMSYVDQTHKELQDGDKTVYDAVSGGQDLITVGKNTVNARAYLSRFNFSGADQQKKLGVLSGGERNRLHLAMTLREGGNVLLLDEPTNDIDVNTLRALEDGLENFAGCILVISHDRWFIDRLATHILSFEDEGEVVFFEGNYSDYETAKKEKLGDLTPRRPRFKNVINR
ncbi:MAG: energy-dependent translational throttle protein EttA [Geminicoccaceae bacterium]|nr:energy-dependent translational throttle protein EttA [Geminicoccaceae bacterium]